MEPVLPGRELRLEGPAPFGPNTISILRLITLCISLPLQAAPYCESRKCVGDVEVAAGHGPSAAAADHDVLLPI
ncbi:MAG: hypothetical protein P8L49_14005, partial [Opitutaceae bacterium]|nr:hypothetical protein [Opitutaceae bacterium]